MEALSKTKKNLTGPLSLLGNFFRTGKYRKKLALNTDFS